MAIALDGPTKVITLTTATTFTDKTIYDAAVDWAVLTGNMQYLLPMDFVAPDYRLLNGWLLNATGYAAGTVITVTGSIITYGGGVRVKAGQTVEWDIGTANNTVLLPVGSGLSTEEHDRLMATLTVPTFIGLK